MKISEIIHTLVAILETQGDLDAVSTTQNTCGDDQMLAPVEINIIELKDNWFAVDFTACESASIKPNPFIGLPL